MPFQKNKKNIFYGLWSVAVCTLYATAVAQTVIHNPVLDRSFPDPTVINTGTTYYAYATQAGVNNTMWNIQVAASTDLQHWRMEKDALPQKPGWAHATQDFWAPHVMYDSLLRKYVMFYSAESDDTTVGKCIGVAYANVPAGPFIDKGTPLICGQGFVTIDPMAFTDPKTKRKYLYWGSGFEPIKVRQMKADWTDFEEGSKVQNVMAPGGEDYTVLVEGAWVDYEGGFYYLYYSGDNCCGTKAHYAVMVAKADSPSGPFETMGAATGTGNSRVVQQDSVWLAPGHNSVFRDRKGNKWMAFHAIERSKIKAGSGERRAFCLRPLLYKNGWPQLINNE